MTSLAPLFFNQRLHEYQKKVATNDPEYDAKLKERELDDKYKEHMKEGCRVFASRLGIINDTNFHIGYKHSLEFINDDDDKKTYFYTGCPELKNFISQFNAQNKNNQIKLNDKDKFVNKIQVNEADIKNDQLNYELSYELEYNTVFKSGYPRSGNVNVPNPPSKDNVFFG